MDKKLSRQIGYVKPKMFTPTKQPVDKYGNMDDEPQLEPKKVSPRAKKELEKMFPKKKEGPTAAQVVAWIKAHPLFKWAALCKLVGLDRSNFSKVLRSETPLLKKEVVDSIAAILRDYGFEN